MDLHMENRVRKRRSLAWQLVLVSLCSL